jgi:putative FmdB family regulatory protein
MPTYEFRCKDCDTTFEERRPMSESNAPATCPEGHPAVRLLSVFASVGARAGSSVSGADLSAAMSAPSAGGGCGSACACH